MKMQSIRQQRTLAWLLIGLACQLSTCLSETSDSDAEIPDAFDYGAFLQKYQKAYGPTEGMLRAKLFFTRTLDIFKSNVLYASHENGHYLHQNEFIDQTPEEIKAMLLNANNDLLPVKEALVSPDTPADQFMKQKVDTSQINDIPTQSSLYSFSAASKQNPVAGFFSNSKELENLDPAKLLRELRSKSELVSKMSKLIKIERKSDDKYQKILDKQAEKVDFKPLIAGTNKEFDPSYVKTQGLQYALPKYSAQFYSNIMTDDFLGYVEPYPEPPNQEAAENNDHDKGILGGFLDSIRAFRGNFFIEDFEEDVKSDEKEEEAPTKNLDDVEGDQKKTGIVYNIDWRQTGCISRLKNQHKCNACYAFATLDLVEYFYCREMGESTEFSAQYVIDCGAKAGLNGCEGGKLSGVKTFINTFGLQVNSLYPYNARDQECPYDEADQHKAFLVKPHIKRWAMFSEIQAWYKWIAKSPIVVGINMPTDFLAYGGGIHSGIDCTPGMVHAMLLVGAGKEDGKPFWLLKNTFSDEWGEGGYFRLSRKAPIKCFNSAVVARVTFKETSQKE